MIIESQPDKATQGSFFEEEVAEKEEQKAPEPDMEAIRKAAQERQKDLKKERGEEAKKKEDQLFHRN